VVSIGDEIAELGREQDRMMHEHADWMARREASLALSVQKSGSEDILYRDAPENAPAPASMADAEPFIDDDRSEADLPVVVFGEGDPRDEILTDLLADLIVGLRREHRRSMVGLHRQFASWRKEQRHMRMILEDEIKVLRKRIDLTDRNDRDDRGSDNVIDLPRGFIRRRNDNAA
jgi:hypothetical protein